MLGNKKTSGFFSGLLYLFGLFAVYLIIGLLICLVIAPFTIPFLNKGQSVDVAYGVEENAFWNKLYLKDDHKTIYCIDDEELLQIAKQASINKQKVKVTYQEYVFKGSLCSFDDKYSSVVVKNIEVINED